MILNCFGLAESKGNASEGTGLLWPQALGKCVLHVEPDHAPKYLLKWELYKLSCKYAQDGKI